MGVRALLVAALALSSESTLEKVVVLARHGCRAPNSQVTVVCPRAEPIYSAFREPVTARTPAALSRLGMAENWESGRFLRERYVGSLLPDAPFYDDLSVFFFSERMDRNIVSTEALVQGMFPDGTGQKGFLPGNPNLVPIRTSQPFMDTIMNLPRDGPCKRAYKADMAAWAEQNEAAYVKENHDLLEEFGKACGFDFTKPDPWGKGITWALKAAADAFNFANNEGIDPTVGGKFPMEMITKVKSLGGTMVNAQRFGLDHQITYWTGRFIEDSILKNLEPPASGDEQEKFKSTGEATAPYPWQMSPEAFFNRNKFLLFLNHRELMWSVATIFQIEEVLKAPLPSGAMLFWELHRDEEGRFVKVFAWKPSQPSWESKHKSMVEGTPVTDLFQTGEVYEVFPAVCTNPKRCVIQDLDRAYHIWTDRTGNWAAVCGLEGDTPAAALFADAEDPDTKSDGDDEDGWRVPFEDKNFGVLKHLNLNVRKAPEPAISFGVMGVASLLLVSFGVLVGSRTTQMRMMGGAQGSAAAALNQEYYRMQ
jgi:hypothetical protein